MNRRGSGTGPRAQGRAEQLAAIAERQWGVVTRAQLQALGFGGTTISRWLANGRLRWLYPGVYALGHGVLVDEGRLTAALLHVGRGSVLSHVTAAWWWGLVEREPTAIHVSTPGDCGSSPAVVVHRPRLVEPVHHRLLPVTTVPRTLLDIASHVPFARLRRALAEADFRRLATLDEVAAVLGRGRAGSAALRRALEMYRPQLARTLSELEDRFLSLCEEEGVPLPEVNVEVCGLVVDALWRQERVVVELDGSAAHATAARMDRDRARDLTLRAAGFVVLRYTWGQVTREQRLVGTDLRAALQAAVEPNGAAARPACGRGSARFG